MSSLTRHVFFVREYVSFYSHMFPSETMYWNFLQLFEKLPYPAHRSEVFFSRIAQLFIPSNAQYSRNLRHFGFPKIITWLYKFSSNCHQVVPKFTVIKVELGRKSNRKN